MTANQTKAAQTMNHRLRLRGWLSVALILLAAARICPAQTPSAEVVRELQVRHLDALPADPQYVLALTSIRVGQFASQAAISRDVRALLDSKRFSYAGVEVEKRDDGVCLVYVVRRRLRFAPPAEIRGATNASPSKVRDWLELDEGAFLDEAILATHSAKVRDQYRKRHYAEVQVESHVEPVDPASDQGRVTVTVREGPRVKVVGLRFTGNATFASADLRRELGQPAWWNPMRLFRKKDFDALAREDARVALRDLYLNRGYLDVQIEPARLEADDDGDQFLVFAIREGRCYRVARAEVTGITLFPTGEVTRAAALPPAGMTASRQELQDGSKRVRDYYGGRGYVDTTVRTVIDPVGDTGTVAVRYEVREGVLAHIRSIMIRGNTRTRDKVIRREIALSPGQILNEVQAERSQRRLENLGYFESVRFFELPAPSDPGQRDVIYEVKEKSTGQFMIGAGFSSVDKIVGFAEITQANFDLFNWPYFSGGGQKARASVEAGSTRTSIDLSLTEPWFLDRRLSLTVEAFRREREYSEYDERRLGTGAGLVFPATVGRLGVNYGIEDVRLDDLQTGDFVFADDPDPARIYRFTDEDDRQFNGNLRLSWSYDTRNRPFVPSRGIQGSLAGTVRGPWTGSDNNLYKLDASFRQWFPLWFKHVLSLKLRADGVDTYGNEEVVGIADRLYLGGGRTLRGFDYRDVGPKVIPADPAEQTGTYRPVGGQTLAMASAEYSIPLAKVLRVAGFYDVGNVWQEAFDADFGELASSMGVGLRVDIPGFPIRVDYAWPLESDDDYTDTQRWVIWIGFD